MIRTHTHTRIEFNSCAAIDATRYAVRSFSNVVISKKQKSASKVKSSSRLTSCSRWAETRTQHTHTHTNGITTANKHCLLSYLCQLLPVRTKFATSGRSKIAMLLLLLLPSMMVLMVVLHTESAANAKHDKNKNEAKNIEISSYWLISTGSSPFESLSLIRAAYSGDGFHRSLMLTFSSRQLTKERRKIGSRRV